MRTGLARTCLVLYPGLAITVTVLAFNLLGDGIRDTLDPRLSPAMLRVLTGSGRRAAPAAKAAETRQENAPA